MSLLAKLGCASGTPVNEHNNPAPAVDPVSPNGIAAAESRAVEAPANKANKVVAGLDQLLENNKQWASERVQQDPNYFSRLRDIQTPDYLWIGCADSRVPANVIVGLDPGEIFVQRNVGNQAMHTDLNCQSCIEYAVTALKVKTIIVCGHYNCGAVKAALRLPSKTPGLVNCWISDIRECRNQHQEQLKGLTHDEQLARLCEFNVLRQVFHVCTTPVVQAAWDQGQDLKVYGVCYGLDDGRLRRLVGPLAHDTDLGTHDPEAFLNKNIVVSSQGKGAEAVSANGIKVQYKSPEPGRPSVDISSQNTAALASRLAAHTSWQDAPAPAPKAEPAMGSVPEAAPTQA